MNIISQFYKLLEKSFTKYLKEYFDTNKYLVKCSDFNNYYSFINSLDSFNSSFVKDIIKSYFEYIDECFFNSSYRKNFCTSNGFYERKNYVTLFGEITFKRRYYFDKLHNDKFFFVDLFFGLPKRKHFDPFVCADICEKASCFNYSKTGKLVADKIGSKIGNTINISRATARNIVMSFNTEVDEIKDARRIEKLYVMLDEKFVGSQFQDNDHMIKASIIFEGSDLVYRKKKNKNSKDRYKLVNSHTCASIDNKLLNDTVNYIYNTYDTNYLKEITFMGDCATWIKNFPKSYWFKFNQETQVNFSIDNFHFSQALHQLTTAKNKDVYYALKDIVKLNDKENFEIICNQFMDLNPLRKDTIENKMNYILNNWNERQFYENHSYLKCSMESHISHIFADLFTSRPKAYSKKGLNQLLKLRLLNVNGYNIKDIYFNNLYKKPQQKLNSSMLNLSNTISFYENKYDFTYTLYLKNKIFFK